MIHAVPSIDVVVVAYNSADVMDDLLDSLPAALGELSARVVVVDNGSSDETVAILERRGGTTVVRETNRGFAAGINRGVHELAGDGPILVLNPDVRLSPGAIAPLVAALGEPGTGIAVPKVVDDAGNLTWSLRREPTVSRSLGLARFGLAGHEEYVADPAVYDAPAVVDWALGAAMLISRECHELLHGWDESYFLYSEETDLCLRARDIGLVTRFVPESVVAHVGGASGRSGRTHAMQVVNQVRLYNRRHSTVAGVLFFVVTLLSELMWRARGNRESAAAVVALCLPWRRPPELGCSRSLVPR